MRLMDREELHRYAYVKRPLHEVFADPSEVPPEFLLEWFKDSFDCERIHSEEEIMDGLSATPAAIVEWLEEGAALIWEAKLGLLQSLQVGSDSRLRERAAR